MRLKSHLRRLFWKFDYDISPFTPLTHPIARMRQRLVAYQIDTVLDVGANAGQFVAYLRNDLHYTNKIISFEPSSSAFASLKEKADWDPDWQALNMALGDTDEQGELYIAGNSYSSSLLEMLPLHLQSAPESAYTGAERVQVKRLDSVFDDLCGNARGVYMKIDTQGFEHKVLNGAARSLARIDTVQLEMSLVPLYNGELLFNDLYNFMQSKGYRLVEIAPGFTDLASGQVLQVDGTFHRFK